METRRIVMTSTFYPPYHLGGDAVHVRYLAEELARQGHEVHVVHSLDAFALKGGNKHPQPIASAVHTHPVETTMGPIYAGITYLTGSNRAVERELWKVLAEVKPDWVHHHNISLLGQGVLAVGHGPKLYTSHDHWLVCPRSDLAYLGKGRCESGDCTYCSLRTGRPPQYWRGEGFMNNVRGLSRIISPSQYMAGFLKEHLGVDSLVLPNFVPRPDELVRADMPPHFVFAGVLEPHKGLDLLLKGHELCGVRSELHVLGKGSLEPMVRDYEQRTGGRVRYLGFLGRGELLPEMASAIALVSPSVCLENSPLSCIEALSVGTPLLVSPNGGLPELISGNCGLIADPTPESLGSAMRTLERQPEMRDLFSRNALGRYEGVHSPSSYLRSYLGLMGGAS